MLSEDLKRHDLRLVDVDHSGYVNRLLPIGNKEVSIVAERNISITFICCTFRNAKQEFLTYSWSSTMLPRRPPTAFVTKARIFQSVSLWGTKKDFNGGSTGGGGYPGGCWLNAKAAVIKTRMSFMVAFSRPLEDTGRQ